jgi:hypothetical protein
MISPTTQYCTSEYALTTTTTRHPDVQKFRPTAIRMGKQVKHRGPDWSGNHIANNTILVHERLSIVGVGECSLYRTHVHTYIQSRTES